MDLLNLGIKKTMVPYSEVLKIRIHSFFFFFFLQIIIFHSFVNSFQAHMRWTSFWSAFQDASWPEKIAVMEGHFYAMTALSKLDPTCAADLERIP